MNAPRFLGAAVAAFVLFAAPALAGADATADAIADKTTSVAAALAANREQAEDALAAERVKIADERANMLTAVQDALRAEETSRQRAAAAAKDRDDAQADLKQRKADHERELAAIRALVDRALVVARIDGAAARLPADAPPRQRLDAALDAVNLRITQLPDLLALHGGSERIIARDGKIVEAPVIRLGQARAIAVGADDSTRGLLTLAGDGVSWRVGGPTFPATVGPADPGPSAPTHIALDPDGSVATRQAAAGRSFAQWVRGGRMWIWPIFGVFILGVAVAVWRAGALWAGRIDPRRLLVVAEMLHKGQAAAAEALVAARATALDRLLAAGLAARTRSRDAREAVVEQALIAETPALQRGLGLLVVLASVAPLLGLLGTVTGMIDMFAVIAQQGSGNARSLSGSISEALICTQAGMMTAIPLLLFHAVLARVAERRLLLLDEAACGMLGLADEKPDDAP
jgi:biopolymer transport protein ExbB